jgi:hypothetical protein
LENEGGDVGCGGKGRERVKKKETKEKIVPPPKSTYVCECVRQAVNCCQAIHRHHHLTGDFFFCSPMLRLGK